MVKVQCLNFQGNCEMGCFAPESFSKMRTDSTVVKSNSKEVGSVTFPIFDTVAEAVSELGEGEVLELVNTQKKTKIMNLKRQEFNKPGKTIFRSKAMASLTLEELQSALGDAAKMDKLINDKIAVLEKEWQASQPAKAETEEDDNV